MMFCFRSVLQIWILLIGFRCTNYFVNLGICKHEFKFTCRGYYRFTLSLNDRMVKLLKNNIIYQYIMVTNFKVPRMSSFVFFMNAHVTLKMVMSINTGCPKKVKVCFIQCRKIFKHQTKDFCPNNCQSNSDNVFETPGMFILSVSLIQIMLDLYHCDDSVQIPSP